MRGEQVRFKFRDIPREQIVTWTNQDESARKRALVFLSRRRKPTNNSYQTVREISVWGGPWTVAKIHVFKLLISGKDAATGVGG